MSAGTILFVQILLSLLIVVCVLCIAVIIWIGVPVRGLRPMIKILKHEDKP